MLFTSLALLSVSAQAQNNLPDTIKQEDLKEVVVAGRYYRKYTANNVSSALRVQTPLAQLSQNIQIIGPAVIRDQAAFNTTDGITRNVSGIVRQEVSNNLGPNIFMRGGQISSLRNGIDLTPLYRGPVPEDAAIIERVEFIKGPSVFMNNIGDPAGTFNVMTKQPSGSKNYSFNAMLGSFDFYRAAVDLDGTFDKEGKLQYRVNAMGMKSRSFVKFDFNDRWLLAPVLKYQLSKQTYISAEYIYQQFRYAMQSPIIMTPNGFGSLPKDFSIHENSLTPYAPKDQNLFVTLHSQVSKDWSLTVRGSYIQNDSKGAYMWVTGVNSSNPQVLLRNPKYDLTRYIVYSQQAFVNGRFRTGPVAHNFLGGFDANQKRFYGDSYIEYNKTGTNALVYYPLDVNNPVYGANVPNYATPGGVKAGNTFQEADYISLYALDEILLLREKLRLTVGARATRLETKNVVSGTTTSSSDFPVTPRVGLNYTINPNLSVYALFDNTFQPQTGIQGIAVSTGTATTYQAGGPIEPLQGRIFDVGIKKDWAGDKWNTVVSFYSIGRKHIAQNIPGTVYREEIGASRSRGVDIDIKGELVKGLSVVINYAFNDSKVTKDINPALVHARTPMYVKNIQNTWLNYNLPARLKSFGLSLGYQYMGGRGERYTTATPHKTPDYFRLDGGVNWHHKKIGVNLLVNNIAGRKLVATPWYRNGLYYWVPNAPRYARLALSYSL